MNIYDFDNTIIKGDSSIKFIKYSLLRHPFKVFICLIKAFKEYIKLLFKKGSLTSVKNELFSFVKDLNDFENYISKKYDVRRWKNIGLNCKGEEKVKRFKKIYKDVKINNAYSDSLSDIPMFKLAKKAYIVKDEKLIEYKE